MQTDTIYLDCFFRIEEQADVEPTYEDPESEEMVLMEEPERPIGQKLRLYKLMVRKIIKSQP